MSAGELTGTLGVSLLLIAFALNLKGQWPANGRVYLLMNTVGALLACISSVLIGFWPFVILEGVWTLSSLWMLLKRMNHA